MAARRCPAGHGSVAGRGRLGENALLAALTRVPVLAIIRHPRPFAAVELLAVLSEAGLTAAEITLDTPHAVKMIAEAARALRGRMLVGCGTVRTAADLAAAQRAGAAFAVSPVFSPALLRSARRRGMPFIPGVLTPSEIYAAYQAGAPVVKVFPAAALGPEYFAALRAPLKGPRLLAVGGITTRNAADYRAAGAFAVAVGGGTIKAEWIDREDYARIRAAVRRVLAAVERVRCR